LGTLLGTLLGTFLGTFLGTGEETYWEPFREPSLQSLGGPFFEAILELKCKFKVTFYLSSGDDAKSGVPEE